MREGEETAVYTCPPHIKWVHDQCQTILIDEDQRRSHALSGVEAAIWSWLTLSYTFTKLTKLTAALLNVTQAEARQRLRATLDVWRQAGWLQVQP